MSDPLSKLLSLLDVQAARCKRLEAGRAFALRFPAKPALKFAAVAAGGCWIRMGDEAEIRLAEGDAFLLANAPPYVLASDVSLPPEDGFAAYEEGRADALRLDGDATVIVSGEFLFHGAAALLNALPPFIHAPAGTRSAAVVRDTLSLLDWEMGGNAAGRALMMRRLADIALIQILRAYLDQRGPFAPMAALSDPGISAALSALHERPAHPWTVAGLAAASGMSRSVFAKRFREQIGLPPLDYLRRCRMQAARESLLADSAPLKRIALDAGYASERAFGIAFKRVFGCPPGACRSAGLRQAPPAAGPRRNRGTGAA